MNFLETLITLSVVALLGSFGIFGYQNLLLRTQVEADRSLIQTALEQARAQGGTVRCNNTDCLIKSAQGERSIALSGKHTVTTQLFPASSQGTFSFTTAGLSAYHNGTITVSPEGKPDFTKKIVVSQGGEFDNL